MSAIKHHSPSSGVADLSVSPANTALLGKVFWIMAEEFDLSPDDQKAILGVTTRQTMSNLKKTSKITQSPDAYRRVSLLLGIKKNLEIMFPDAEIRKNWLHVARDTFKGKSALEFIKANPLDSQARLFTVRRLLDMLRNGAIPTLI